MDAARSRPSRRRRKAVRAAGIDRVLAKAVLAGLIRHPAEIARHMEVLGSLKLADGALGRLFEAVVDLALEDRALDSARLVTILATIRIWSDRRAICFGPTRCLFRSRRTAPIRSAPAPTWTRRSRSWWRGPRSMRRWRRRPRRLQARRTDEAFEQQVALLREQQALEARLANLMQANEDAGRIRDLRAIDGEDETAAEATRRGEMGDAPLIDLNDASIKKLIARAKKRGYITYDQLNEALPQDQMSSEQIEDVMSALNEMGVNIVENDEAGEDGDEQRRTTTTRSSRSSDGDDNAPALETKKKETVDRTDDPVRMYLREMGAVELLSREGEIAIAKRIEAGRDTMILGLCESPITFNAIIDWSTALNEGTMQLREILDLDAMLSKGPTAEQVEGAEDDESARSARRPPAPPSRKRKRSRKRPSADEDEDDMTERRAPRTVRRRGRGQHPQPRADGGAAQAAGAREVRRHHRALQEILQDPGRRAWTR